MQNMTHRILVASLLAGLLALTPALRAAGEGWSQWRGPARDGKSADTGLLKEWPAGGPALAWKATGLGDGHASVSISGERIFTMGDKDGASHVIALGLADGKILWSVKVGKMGAPGWGGHAGPRSTPTVDGDLVFAVDQWGEMICLEAASGKERWRQSFERNFGAPRPEWGFAESPIVDGGRVIVTPGGPKGAMVALDRSTGAVIWRTKDFTDGAQYASAVIAGIGGVRQYIQITDASVAGIGAEDGKLLWRADRKGSTAVIPTPIQDGGFVYVTSGYGVGCNLFQVTAEGGVFKAEQVYANKDMTNHHGGTVKVGDHVYGYSDGKGWVCQEFKTGKTVWREKEKLGKGSVSFADGLLYCREEGGKGTVALLEPSPSGYSEKGRFEQPDRSKRNSWPHPVITGGMLYIRDQDVLLCYKVKI